MSRKLLKFGGPGLPPGTHTFVRYRQTNPNECMCVQDAPPGMGVCDWHKAHPNAGCINPNVGYGQSLPADEIEDAQGYLDRGQASVIDDPLDSGGPATQSTGAAKKPKGNV